MPLGFSPVKRWTKKINTTNVGSNDTDLQHLYDPASFTYIICKIYTDLLSLESKQPKGFWSKNASKCLKICPKGFSRNSFWFQHAVKCWACVLREQGESTNCFVDFKANVNKWQYLKIYSLEFKDIWQNCSYYLTQW